MSIRSKFPGVCRNCNGRFDAGTLIEWSKGAGSSHVTCPAKSAALFADRDYSPAWEPA